ncbi:putative Fungal N-terminal domain-containing protein [Seiridium unicorne]|uniref:Fungal N-terminal domain-containing protein n=1 Tax=Seiridium unicorne TaxID=138068 RepID=A0ABR2UWE7_9PEZI
MEEVATSIIPASTEAESSNNQRGNIGLNHTETGETEPTTLVDDLNIYLHELNVYPLSEQEAEFVNEMERQSPNVNGFSQMLTNCPGSEEPRMFPTTQPLRGDRNGSDKAKFDTGGRFFMPLKFDFGIDHMASLGLASNIPQIVVLSAKLASSTSRASRMRFRSECNNISRRLMQCSMLLQTASDIIRFSIPTTRLQNMGWDILNASTVLCHEVQDIIDGLKLESQHSTLKAVFAVIKWHHFKEEVLAVLERIESSKSSLSIMLQLHTTLQAERDLQSVNSFFVVK